MDYDVIVIGSGFGGAISACRLQQAGLRVLVLERGRRWDKSNFPRQPTDRWIWDAERPEHKNGWLELRHWPNMSVAVGAAVGGGSHIYANISTEAPPDRFLHGWPEAIRYEELKPHYDRVAQVMEVKQVPDNQEPLRTKLVREAAQKTGRERAFRKLELAVRFDDAWTYEKDFVKGFEGSKTVPASDTHAEQGTCVHCGQCDIGCPTHAKNTLDLNYLYMAENKGCQVRPLHLVTDIEPLSPGYRVHYDAIETGSRVAGSATAERVVVAAGSIGSSELLLRCQRQSLPRLSRALGTHWSSNGDFLTPALYPRTVNPSDGPTITAAIDSYAVDRAADHWVQDGGFPALARGLLEHFRSEPGVRFKTRMLISTLNRWFHRGDLLQNVMPWFAQGLDAGNGVLELSQRSLFDPRLELKLKWDVRASQRHIQAVVDEHVALSTRTGGLPLVPPTWTLFKDLITPHPLGGCPMADTATDGVVDHAGEVFGYPGLYVIDGAIIPTPLGVNPSRTIGALAERAAALMIAR